MRKCTCIFPSAGPGWCLACSLCAFVTVKLAQFELHAGSMPFCSSIGMRSSTGLVTLLQMQRSGRGWTPCSSKLVAHR